MLAAYLLLGWRVLLTAVKNIGKGRVFDENFLMALATIGAWAIGSFDEAVGVMLFYRVGEFFEDRAVERSRRQIMAAVDLRPETVQLVAADGSTRTIPAEDAAVGDIVLVRPGDRVPLDGEVTEGESRLDTSAVTGEPVPVRVAPGDKAMSGCVNTDGAIKLRVTHVLAESMVQRILDSVENAAARKPKIDRFITRFSRVYTPAVVAIALLTAIVPSLVTGNWSQWVYTALTFLVISCPCALVLSVPLTYFAGIGVGSKRGILFKGGASLEALNNVKTIVMDKTGTITKGNFVVQRIVPAPGVQLDETELLWLAAACEGASTHPIAKSILTAYETRKEAAAKADRPNLVLTEGMLEDIHEQAGEGVEATLDGKTVLCGNRKLLARHGVDLSAYQGTPGSTEVLLAADGRYIGHIVIADTVKTDAQSAVARMKAQGLTTAMLTGDGQDSADAVAQSVGIDEVRARLLPEDKLTALSDIRAKRGAVMFVGDGINDAPVLAGADVGAAMGSGADAAIEAADVVFMNADLSSIPASVKIARKANIISKENIVFALAVQTDCHGARPVRHRVHVAGRVRRHRRRHAVRAQLGAYAVYENRIIPINKLKKRKIRWIFRFFYFSIRSRKLWRPFSSRQPMSLAVSTFLTAFKIFASICGFSAASEAMSALTRARWVSVLERFGRTVAGQEGKPAEVRPRLHIFFARQVQRADEFHAGIVFRFDARQHGLHLPAVDEAHEHGFDRVVVVVAERNFVAAALLRRGIQVAAPHFGAQKTGVLRCVIPRDAQHVGLKDFERQLELPGVCLELCAPGGRIARGPWRGTPAQNPPCAANPAKAGRAAWSPCRPRCTPRSYPPPAPYRIP